MANPYVFIVGCARSGTTLLRRIVNAHPQIAIMPESHWITRLLDKGDGLTSEGLATPELIPCLFERSKFVQLRISRGKLRKLMGTGDPISYADFVARIFDLYGKRESKSLVGDKTPSYVRRLNTLHALWPKARFVHLIRDGRDVCLSIADWPTAQLKKPGIFSTWKSDPVSTSAFWWEANVRLGREAGNSLGRELYYEMRYESLVSNPAKECAALCDFLGLPYNEAMLRFHEGKTKRDPGLSAKHAWRPITLGLRDWRSQMPAENVGRFEAGVGELLDELNYPRALPYPRRESLEEAEKVRDLLARDSRWIEVLKRARIDGPEPASRVADSLAKSAGTEGLSERRSQA